MSSIDLGFRVSPISSIDSAPTLSHSCFNHDHFLLGQLHLSCEVDTMLDYVVSCNPPKLDMIVLLKPDIRGSLSSRDALIVFFASLWFILRVVKASLTKHTFLMRCLRVIGMRPFSLSLSLSLYDYSVP